MDAEIFSLKSNSVSTTGLFKQVLQSVLLILLQRLRLLIKSEKLLIATNVRLEKLLRHLKMEI